MCGLGQATKSKGKNMVDGSYIRTIEEPASLACSAGGRSVSPSACLRFRSMVLAIAERGSAGQKVVNATGYVPAPKN